MSTLIYIAPSSGETHHPQARIYAHSGPWPTVMSVGEHYKRFPNAWREVGLMNYQGMLVCFEGPDVQRQELLASQPLMAGTAFLFAD